MKSGEQQLTIRVKWRMPTGLMNRALGSQRDLKMNLKNEDLFEFDEISISFSNKC